MLNSIKIQNYRNLKHLSIEKLGKVNLIIGKNNTGKTSLLEAIYLFKGQNDADIISKIIASRGERYLIELSGTDSEKTLQMINNLFWKRNEGNNQKIEMSSDNQYFSLCVTNVASPQGIISPRSYMLAVERDGLGKPRNIFLNGPIGELQFFPSDESSISDPEKVKFVLSTISNPFPTNPNQLAADLDNISLGDNYNDVIGALQIIDSDIVKVVYLSDDNSNIRFPVVRLKNRRRVSLLSMGDGINRILTIIIAMVSCENGYLLIDEFENGLHYSVQEKLWEIIFYLAQSLNIQVFVTTHSNDTIHSFENVVNKNETQPLDGLLIKLENIDDNIESLIFEPSELKVITEHLIEVRK